MNFQNARQCLVAGIPFRTREYFLRLSKATARYIMLCQIHAFPTLALFIVKPSGLREETGFRKSDFKLSSHARLTLNSDFAAMQIDNAPDDR